MARRANSQDGFVAYTSNGGLLPAPTLRRIVDQPDTMPAGGPDGYQLPPRAKLDEHIDRAWHDARAYWNDFKTRAVDAGLLDANADATTGQPGDPTLAKLTRDRLVLPLLDLLGWHDLERRRDGIEGNPDRRDADGTRQRWPVTHEAVKRHVPLHIVGYDVPLDRRSPGVYGAERQSPHSTAQDLLNGSDRHLWAIVANGAQLRLLRDSTSLTRQAYAEFDLATILDDGVFTDFVALWLLVHATRFTLPDTDDATSADLPIERLQRDAVDDGIRALDHLRDAVQHAIEALGTGLLAHPANQPLRDALDGGELTAEGLYNEVLRTVYRLVFLFAVEDRDLLHPPDADPGAITHYREHYTTQRLREQARRHRGGRHGDGWRHYQTLVACLREGQPALAIPPVAGWLWSTDAALHVDACELDNRSLYTALRQLTTIEQDRALHRVSYKHLGAEELGSVYEALLELVPRTDGRRFWLDDLAGNARKTTGSYYTPTSLIARVLDDALDPVVDRTLQAAAEHLPAGADSAERQATLEQVLLDLTVCDAAMGSAHFLVAAAHRLAQRLASLRTDDPEPDPESVQDALRDVVAHCIYGVDVNPMAVELAKVALWLECHVPGAPLTFLDHHLKCGNALLGAGLDPTLIRWRPPQGVGDTATGGVPDDAFKALHGDDQSAARRLRDANRTRRDGQASLLASGQIHEAPTGELAQQAAAIDSIDDRTADGLSRKQDAYRDYTRHQQLVRERLKADAWTACWTMSKTSGQAAADDQPFDVYYDCHYDELPADTRPGVERTRDEARHHRFFHWYVEFPEVAEAGGFSCLLGNPPWERLKIQQKEWFANRGRADIADARNAAARRRAIETLYTSDDPAERRLASDWDDAQHAAAAHSNLVRASGRFPHGGVGDVNLYALFADLYLGGHNSDGGAGFICPPGLATGATYSDFFSHLVDNGRLVTFWTFENEDRIFPAVHHDQKFALVTFTGVNHPASVIGLTGYVRHPDAIDDPTRRYELTADDIEAINPNTKTAPLFRRSRDAHLTAKLHRNAGVLIDERVPADDPQHNPWQVGFLSMFHMANDSELFHGEDWAEEVGASRDGNVLSLPDGTRALPLYEGKMIWHYDHRAGTYEGQTEAQANLNAIPPTSDEQKADPAYTPEPRYWVEGRYVAERLEGRWERDWFIGWRDVSNVVNERTLVSTVLPRVAAGHTLSLMLSAAPPTTQLLLVGALSSLAVDYSARGRSSRMMQYVVKQLPLGLDPHVELLSGQRLQTFVAPRVVELTYTAWDLEGWARDVGYAGPPFRWDSVRRPILQAEVDAALFHGYGLDRDETESVLDSFTALRRNECRDPRRGGYGEYRTKRLVLERYDEMTKAAETGIPYESPLEPPPADDAMRHAP